VTLSGNRSFESDLAPDGKRVAVVTPVEAVFSVCLGRRGDSRVFSGPEHTRLSPRLRVVLSGFSATAAESAG